MAEQTMRAGSQATKPRTYTDEYRRQVVDMVTSTGRTAMSVAAELGIHHTLISRWLRRYGRMGSASAQTSQAASTPPHRPVPMPHADQGGRHSFPVAPNLLNRQFTATRPNQVWLADLTYIPTGEGWLYLAAIMDLHTRKVVGWSMRDHLHAELATAALTMAIQRQRPQPGLIQHSDRGIQYACLDYQEVQISRRP